jgi:hypothetical protein
MTTRVIQCAFDHASLDAPAAASAARLLLGDHAFEVAYQGGRELDYPAPLALAQDTAGDQVLRR